MRAENVSALLPGLVSEKINTVQTHEFTVRKKIPEIQLLDTNTDLMPRRKALRRLFFSAGV